MRRAVRSQRRRLRRPLGMTVGFVLTMLILTLGAGLALSIALQAPERPVLTALRPRPDQGRPGPASTAAPTLVPSPLPNVVVTYTATPPSPSATPSPTPSATSTVAPSPTPTVAPTATDTAAPSPSAAPSVTPRIHVVEQGDSLYKIAQRYGTTIEAIMAANNITDRRQILHVGDQLLIPELTPTPEEGPS